jgi:mono/diheme cytochrome c family protein
MNSRFLAAASSLLACVGLCSLVGLTSALAQGERPVGDPEHGRQLFYDHACYGCHGYNGETGARALVGTGSPLVENVDAFIAFLRARADAAPLFPSTRMPSYAESTLSDADARDIFAYIQTFELDAPDPDDIPALQAILESAAGR